YKYLILIKLDLIFFDIQVVGQFWEEQDTGKVERIINIQVNMEEWVFKLHRVQFAVEILIVFVLQFRWSFSPGWSRVVNDIIYFLSFRFCVLSSIFRQSEGFCSGPELNWNRHELVVFQKQFTDSGFLQEFCGIFGYMKDYFGTAAVFFSRFFQCEFRAAVAGPSNGRFSFFI